MDSTFPIVSLKPILSHLLLKRKEQMVEGDQNFHNEILALDPYITISDH